MVNTVKIDTRLIDLPWTTSTNYRFDIEEGFTREVGGNRSPSKSQLSVLTATTFASGPTITDVVSPPYNATGVYDTTASFNFTHGALAKTNAIYNIYLNQKIGSTGTLIATIGTTSSRVTSVATSVEVNLLGLIDQQRTYYLTGDENAFEDMFRFQATGAISESRLKFTTGVGALITSTIPAANTSTRYPIAILTYDRSALTAQSANYKLYTSTGTLVTTIAGTDSKVSISTGTVSINLKDHLQPNRSYYINAEEGVVKDSIQFSSVSVTSTTTVKIVTGSYISGAPTLTINNPTDTGSIWMNSTLIAASDLLGVTRIYNRSTGALVRTITLPNIDRIKYFYGQGLAMNETHIAISETSFTASPPVASKTYVYLLSNGSLLHTLTNGTADLAGAQLDMNSTHLLIPNGQQINVVSLSSGTVTYQYGVNSNVLLTADRGAISDSYIVYYQTDSGNYLYVHSATTGEFLRRIVINVPESINISNTHAIVSSAYQSPSVPATATVYRLSDGATIYTVTDEDQGSSGVQDNDITNEYFANGDTTGVGIVNIYSMTTGQLILKLDNPNIPFGTATNNQDFGSKLILNGSNILVGYDDNNSEIFTNNLISKFDIV
jgi:hypothetical protein